MVRSELATQRGENKASGQQCNCGLIDPIYNGCHLSGCRLAGGAGGYYEGGIVVELRNAKDARFLNI